MALLSMLIMIGQTIQTKSTESKTEIATHAIFYRIELLVRRLHFPFCRYFSLLFSVESTFVYNLNEYLWKILKIF